MQHYLQSYIKPVIEEFPEIGTVLQKYGIGCTDCNVGTCKLVDIIEIHNLSGETSEELIRAMGEVIYKGAPFEVPKIERKQVADRGSLSPAVRKMVNEHTYIKMVIASIPGVISLLESDLDAGIPVVEKVVDFIKNYADGYHHAKEEDVLFGYFDAELDILKVMYEDHDTGRGYVKNIVAGVAEKNLIQIAENLSAYGALLTEHIQKEDDILFPWMDRTLSDKQIGELYARCITVDSSFGEKPKAYEQFAQEAAAQFVK